MNRRNFVSYLTSAGVALRSKLFSPGDGTRGLMTPADCIRLRESGVYLRVLLDGVDVSHVATLANDREGWVEVHVLGSDGGLLLEAPKYKSLQKKRLTGDVKFRRVSAEEWTQLHRISRRWVHGLSKDNPTFREHHA